MPLNDNEQKILEEIERRLSEEDPRLVEQVTRTDLHTHAWGRMKMAIAGFVVGSVDAPPRRLSPSGSPPSGSS